MVFVFNFIKPQFQMLLSILSLKLKQKTNIKILINIKRENKRKKCEFDRWMMMHAQLNIQDLCPETIKEKMIEVPVRYFADVGRRL